MDDIIAIRVTYEDGPTRYFLTWGRIQDPVDRTQVEALVAAREANRGDVKSCTVCDSLQEAAHSRYFYECLFDIARRPMAGGDGYDAWRRDRDEAMRSGKELWDCGTRAQGTERHE